ADGRAPADELVVLAHGAGARARDHAREPSLPEEAERQRNEIVVVEQVEQERLDGVERVGAAHVHQDDRDLAHVPPECTCSTSATACSGGVPGKMPCPRLNTWRLPPARRSTSLARRFTSSTGPNKRHGSRLPCSVMPSPVRARASSSGVRQSTPSASAPSRAASARSEPPSLAK